MLWCSLTLALNWNGVAAFSAVPAGIGGQRWYRGRRAAPAAVVLAPEVGAAVRGPDAAAQDRDARAFIRAQQRRLLQNLCQVAIAGRIPADDRLERNAVHAQELRVRTAVLARRVVIRVV